MLAGSQLEVTPLRWVSIKGRGRAAETVDLTSPSQRPGSDGTDLFALLMAPALRAGAGSGAAGPAASVSDFHLTRLWDNLRAFYESGSPRCKGVPAALLCPTPRAVKSTSNLHGRAQACGVVGLAPRTC